LPPIHALFFLNFEIWPWGDINKKITDHWFCQH
jgi:hypothetical protein